MSCMMMTPEALAALSNFTETALNTGFEYMGFDVPEELHEAAHALWAGGMYNARMIFERLYALNATAYAGRYNEEDVDTTAPDLDISRHTIHHRPEYADHHHAVKSWHYQAAKLLDFWLYQTAESATIHDPLRSAMYKFRGALFEFIVERSPEYDSFPWGRL